MTSPRMVKYFCLSIRLLKHAWIYEIPSRFSCKSEPRNDTSSHLPLGWKGRGGRRGTRRPRPEQQASWSGSSMLRGPSTLPALVMKHKYLSQAAVVEGEWSSHGWSLMVLQSVIVLDMFICLCSSAGIFDPYIPPEGDARLSTLSKEGLKQRTEQIRQSASSQLAYVKFYHSFFFFLLSWFLP